MADRSGVAEAMLDAMSPTDLIRLRAELAAKEKASPEKRATNAKQNAWDALSVIPGPGNVISAMDAYGSGKEAIQAAGEGDWKRSAIAAGLAGLSGVGAVTGMPFGRAAGAVARDASNTVRGIAGPLSKTADNAYVRRTRGETPDTGVGYMMFAHNKGDPTGDSTVGHYGPNVWQTHADGAGVVNADDIRDDIVESLLAKEGFGADYARQDFGRSPREVAEELADSANPHSIVDSAGVWDDPALVAHLWDDLFDRKGINTVVTRDGLVTFDPSRVSRFTPPE